MHNQKNSNDSKDYSLVKCLGKIDSSQQPNIDTIHLKNATFISAKFFAKFI